MTDMSKEAVEQEKASRTYTWNGGTFPISMPHLTDTLMAGRVRMLVRDEWMHEAVCVAARDRIMCLVAERDALLAEREALRQAAAALRDDMLERARYGMDAIHGEQYRIVNAGNGAWQGFCAALDTTAAKGVDL